MMPQMHKKTTLNKEKIWVMEFLIHNGPFQKVYIWLLTNLIHGNVGTYAYSPYLCYYIYSVDEVYRLERNKLRILPQPHISENELHFIINHQEISFEFGPW